MEHRTTADLRAGIKSSQWVFGFSFLIPGLIFLEGVLAGAHESNFQAFMSKLLLYSGGALLLAGYARFRIDRCEAELKRRSPKEEASPSEATGTES